MNAIRKGRINVLPSSTIELFFVNFMSHNIFFLNLCQCDMFLNNSMMWVRSPKYKSTVFCESLYVPVNIKETFLSHMSEILQPWIILAVSEGRANASWRSAHFSGGRALSGIARYGRRARHAPCVHARHFQIKGKGLSLELSLIVQQSHQARPVLPWFFLCLPASVMWSHWSKVLKGGGGVCVRKLSLSQCRFIAHLFSTPMEGWLQLQVADSRLSGGIRSITCMLKHWRSKSDKFYWDENNEFNLPQNNGSFSGRKKKKTPDLYCIKLENSSSRSEYIYIKKKSRSLFTIWSIHIVKMQKKKKNLK